MSSRYSEIIALKYSKMAYRIKNIQNNYMLSSDIHNLYELHYITFYTLQIEYSLD
jgi:hypothetical protein